MVALIIGVEVEEEVGAVVAQPVMGINAVKM
jgi:hypothetical protein